MKSKIAFVLFLIGCAGIDGNFPVSAVLVLISIFILWKESKKIDAPQPKRTSIK